MRSLISWFLNALRDGYKFGIVGLVGFFVDLGIYNWLWLMSDNPIWPKVVSVVVATLVTWSGNRYWTWRDRRRHNLLLELVEFAAIAGLGMAISLLCLWVSHYLLGFTSQLADNISANVVGLILGTLFRFVMYRYWVYGTKRTQRLAERAAAKTASAAEPAPLTAPISITTLTAEITLPKAKVAGVARRRDEDLLAG